MDTRDNGEKDKARHKKKQACESSCLRVCECVRGKEEEKEETQSHNKSLSMSESDNRKTITLEGKQ